MPSVSAACCGALVAGAVEAGELASLRGIATIGFVALVGVPVLLIASALARGLWIAWRPGRLVVREAGDSTPLLAGWVGVAWLASFALGWAMFQGTWLLASWTAFKPLPLSFLMPMLAVVTMLAIIALSRPVALAIAWLVRALDRRWQRRGRRTLVRPRVIVAGAAITWLATLYVIWQLLVERRLGTLDTEILLAPLAGIATAAIVHAVHARLGRARTIVSLAAAGACIAAIAVALHATQKRANLAIAVWADEPLASIALGRVLDLQAIRARVDVAPYRLAARPGATHPDIVLVTIDTLRADRTPPHQGPAQMPALRDLGQQGTVFLWAFAPSSSTRRSIASLATGFSPERVRGRSAGWGFALDPRHIVLAERLRAGGYQTAGFFCCEDLWGPRARTGWARGLEHVAIEPDGKRLARSARTWIEARDDRRPRFVWVHLLEPSERVATAVPRTDDERRRFYDHQLAAADAALGELVSAPTARQRITIVTSDHGQGLGEHGEPYHGTDLYNAQLHVPLVIAGPGIRAQRIIETVGLIDVVPTILELAGFVPPPGDGRSLADIATGRRPSASAGLAYAFLFDERSGKQDLGAVIRGGWKLIDSGTTTELYDLRSDPAERYNLFGQRSQIVNELRSLLLLRRKAASRSPFGDVR